MYPCKSVISQCIGLTIFLLSMGTIAQPVDHNEVTFAADIAPILYENCVRCHRPGGVGPMALISYEQVRPWAPLIKYKTELRDQRGAMPPYYLERGIGIQHFKDDERLTEEQIGKIASWTENGAPMGS
ncbi:MAG: cytochrome c, partial [Proteobacteria bacterium]|nr:cytochrome c [Pseudomonadota bacterium]